MGIADEILHRITPEVQSAQWAWGDASRLSISLADRYLLEVPYETPNFVGSPVGILPYCDKEDVDFGMFVDRFLKQTTRTREGCWPAGRIPATPARERLSRLPAARLAY